MRIIKGEDAQSHFREFRKSKKINQDVAAELIGIGTTTYCFYERGMSSPTLDRLIDIGKVLGFEVFIREV